jgi:CheY-like chemotaxis protein/AraC-like DNA-binding protein/anti-sigma regulatory factor (Ser/Thr protein kinase)
LTVARGDIGQFVRETCLNYKELNRNPKVQFVCRIAEDLPMIWFDSEIITTVLNNLLSNAMKYTDEGSITTTVEAIDGMLRIAVADTGYGIKPEVLPHVFERYYQAKDSHQASGTGIGLALVKSLAELHEGSISVESREGHGSCFTFAIAVDNTYPNALHKEDNDEPAAKSNEMADTEEELADNKEEMRPQLLVVEDNADIRQYITDTFSDDFRILQAENGEVGVQMAEEHNPDIIVSDIMMPQKNGIELTRQLKSDIRTCHIPIILLTAKTTDDDKEEGYDSGADSYLTKPFTAKLLASRIRNLLTARRRLTEMIANGDNPLELRSLATEGTLEHPAPNTPQLSPLDQEFIERLNGVIEDHIMQADIDMAFVTDKMAMSHSTFYRKVKALTGMTATEYVRKRRLRHCYQLLASGDYNVNQAAIITGFNQMAHFRETFKKEFGILPSEVKREVTSIKMKGKVGK